jgi:rSAM/selenodomain-associated transferase 1
MKNKNALIIIAKYPEKESVKTRLKGMIPDEKRVELYESLLEHTLQELKAIPGIDTYIAFAPQDAEQYFSQFKINLISLNTCDLGVNMFYAFRKVLSMGYQKAALVGVDIPDLSVAIIRKAFDILNENDIVYGPAEDGGYYLVGMKKPVKEVFENVPWSSDRTLKKSLERAEKSGYSVGFTETLSDIDTIEDVRKAGFLNAGISNP